jgi:hypothetical protein
MHHLLAVVAGRPTIGFGYTPFTFPFTMIGQPSITAPCGVAVDGLPVGSKSSDTALRMRRC